MARLLVTFFVFLSPSLFAADHVIEAGPREFKPPIIYVAVGDNVQFSKMVSHNSSSVENMIPEGVEPWASDLGENISLKLDKAGIYSYVCVPHIGFGMVGVIIVGDISANDIAIYKAKALIELKGPFRRLLGKINKIKPTI